MGLAYLIDINNELIDENAAAGKSGYITEEINGTKMLVFYHPVKAVQTSWAILDMQSLTKQ